MLPISELKPSEFTHRRLILSVSTVTTSVSVVTLRVDRHIWHGSCELQASVLNIPRSVCDNQQRLSCGERLPPLQHTSQHRSRGEHEPVTTVVGAQSISGLAIV